jgi:hypothetical protein
MMRARRVRRLGLVSLVALGIVCGLAVTTLKAPLLVESALLAGWALMPAVLFASLAWPMLRLGLTLPATLVTLGLLAITVGWLLWYRLLPVPAALTHPF